MKKSYQMFKLVFLTSISFFLVFNVRAEIIIEYRVIPHKKNLFIDERLALPYTVILSLSEKAARMQKVGQGNTTGFDLYKFEKDFYYTCLDFMGNKKAYKLERQLFEITSIYDTVYNILGTPCKKAIGEMRDSKIEIYYTEIYGIGFHPKAKISGIPLLYTVDHEVFDKVTYEAINITVTEIDDDMFTLKGFEVNPIRVEKESRKLRAKPAPTIEVKDLANEKITLNFAQNSITVVNLWFEGCKPCLQEIPYLNLIVDSLEDKVNFVAISLDQPDVVNEFLSSTEFKYQHFANGKSAANRFGADTYPMHLIINKKGEIIYRKTGYGTYSIYTLFVEIKNLLQSSNQ